MGSLILCHNKRAKQPFEIKQVHQKIYTIEELCYYIYNNIYPKQIITALIPNAQNKYL